MPTIRQVDAEQIISRLSDLEQLESQFDELPGPRCVIISAGFEPRIRSFFDSFTFRDDDRLLVIKYPEFSEPFVKDILEKKSDAKILNFDESNISPELQRYFAELGTERYSTILDISGMASVAMFPVLFAIFKNREQDSISIVYTEANEYGPSKSDWDTFYQSIESPSDNIQVADKYLEVNFQSVGVSTVFSSPIFPGVNEKRLPSKVVAIPSFALERMKAKIAHCYDKYGANPEETVWLLGKPPSNQNNWRLDALTKLYSPSQSSETMYPVSTRTYQEVFRVLEDVWQDHKNSHHLLIATNASKMQNLSLFLFLWMRGTVGLILSRPKTYEPVKYSAGTGPKWWLSLGKVLDLRNSLEQVDNLIFHWD